MHKYFFIIKMNFDDKKNSYLGVFPIGSFCDILFKGWQDMPKNQIEP